MKSLKYVVLTSLLGVSLLSAIPSRASEKQQLNADSSSIFMTEEVTTSPQQASRLFVNLTTDDSWRGGMAINFATKVLKSGHPVTIFLNVTGVKLVSNRIPQHTNGLTGKTLQAMLVELIDQGGKVIVCPQCMQQVGMDQNDLIDGVVIGSPEVTQGALFTEGTTVMSW